MGQFQNFNVQGGPEYGIQNLPKLRQQLTLRGVDGFLVPHEDEYQNEYLPECNDRLMWASGFTGSAGAAVVMADKAAIFTDGRYTLQVRDQVEGSLFEYVSLEETSVASWVAANVSRGEQLGYDPRLHSPKALAKIKAAVTKAGGSLIALDPNPIDSAWEDRPAAPKAKLTVQPLKLAGESHADKRARISKSIKTVGANAALITAPASIAWLLNVRGGDVHCTPLPLSTLIVDSEGKADLFIDPDKITDEVRNHLGNQVSLHTEDRLTQHLKSLSGLTIMVDPATTSAWYSDTLHTAGAKVLPKMDPAALPKACKNSAEIAGTKAAHIRDGAAVTRFLHWLDTTAQDGKHNEIEAAQKLESFRVQNGDLKDLSFETISGAGSNGAIVHFRVTTATVKNLERGTLFLVDSGGQYQDGTTDITRTVPIGTPTDEMRERFTLVLKGHIALARVRFPEGISGSNLDSLARMALWERGLDYDHGTGHGVGVFLGVHEGPQRISKTPNNIALRPGMIVSNEPGYYKAGGYGIRIENLQFVTPATEIKGGERKMLGFENLTWAPLHKGLIDTSLLTEAEIAYVNEYHARVLELIGPQVDGEVKDWLIKACEEL